MTRVNFWKHFVHFGFTKNSDMTSLSFQSPGAAPFHYDEIATRERDACDYSIKITYEMALAGQGNVFEIFSS